MLEIYHPYTFTYWDISLFYKIAVDIHVEKKCIEIHFIVGVPWGTMQGGGIFLRNKLLWTWLARCQLLGKGV